MEDRLDIRRVEGRGIIGTVYAPAKGKRNLDHPLLSAVGRVDAGRRLESGHSCPALTRSASFTLRALPGKARDEQDWIFVKRKSNLTKSSLGYLNSPGYLWEHVQQAPKKDQHRTLSQAALEAIENIGKVPAVSGNLICYLFDSPTWQEQMLHNIQLFKATKESRFFSVHVYDDYGEEIDLLDDEGYPDDKKIEDVDGKWKWPLRVRGQGPEGFLPPDEPSQTMQSAVKSDIDEFKGWVYKQEEVLLQEAEKEAKAKAKARSRSKAK